MTFERPPTPQPENLSPDTLSFNDPAVQQEYIQKIMENRIQHKEEVSESDAKAMFLIIQMIREKYEAAVSKKGLSCREDMIFKNLADSLDESSANFNSIFPEHRISWHRFLEFLQQNPQVIEVKVVEPLEYFKDVGNGMSPEQERASIEKTRRDLQTKDPELAEGLLSEDKTTAVNTALRLINDPTYVYTILDKTQVEEGLRHRYDHIAVTRFHLEQLAKGYALSPAVVIRFSPSEEKFGPGITKTILDGTHRALATTYARRELFVMEIDMNVLINKDT